MYNKAYIAHYGVLGMKGRIHRAMGRYNSNKRKAARLDFKSDLYGGLGKTKKSERFNRRAEKKKRKVARAILKIKPRQFKAYTKFKNDKINKKIAKLDKKIAKVDKKAMKKLHKQKPRIMKGQILLFPLGPVGLRINLGESKYDRYQNRKKDLRKGQTFYRKMIKENNRTISQVRVEQERWKKWA